MNKVIINGRMSDSVASSDRGLLYGDGLFETVAVVNGEPGYWQQHLQRLQAGCSRLGIETVDERLLAEESRQLLAGVDRAVLKIIVTRGSGGRGYRVPEQPAATRILQLHDWPVFPDACAQQGVVMRTCEMRLGHNPALAGIKHLNRLEQVMARREWDDTSIAEGLLLDIEGNLVEGTMSNLFLVRDGVLLTPDLQRCGVAGIMRSQVLGAAAGLPVDVGIRPLDMMDLEQADEVFICNSVIGIWPVIAVDGRKYPKGVITSRIQSLLASATDAGEPWQT